MIPRVRLILDYNSFFDENPPENRISIIKGISRKYILFEISALNYRLKKKTNLFYDTSLERQLNEFKYFCGIDNSLLNFYTNRFTKYIVNPKDYPLVFNRAANLFAMEEIINCDELKDIEDFKMSRIDVWDSILKYLLSINTLITNYENIKKEKPTLEELNAPSLVLNELLIEDNPLLDAYKGIKLIDYFQKHKLYCEPLYNYFNEVVKSEPKRFIFDILSLYISNQSEDSDLEFFYHTKEENKALEFFSTNRIKNKNIHTLLSIKKCPFYKDKKNTYIILDINFLINKTFNFLINDFWFDYLKKQKDDKGNEIYSFQDFKGAVGYFYEEYVREIFDNCFSYYKHPKPLLFDELKIDTSKGKIEIADIYLRQNKKILVGQVKSGTIYDKEKYAGEMQLLYQNNRDDFFDNFGVNQLIKSIHNIINHYNKFDSKLEVNKQLHFYPILIFSDKIFRTPLFSNVFNERFQELLIQNNFGNNIVHPLTVINISELETIEYYLAKKTFTIWDLLNSHYQNKRIVPPFYNTVYKFIKYHFLLEKVELTLKSIFVSPEDN